MRAALIAACLASSAAAETVTWEAFDLTRLPGKELIAGGVRTYSPEADIAVEERQSADGASWSKALALNETFAIAVKGDREPRVEGFALVVERPGEARGFSWEWFDRTRGNVFEKRQGTGRLLVTLSRAPGFEEVASVEFLDDIALGYLDDMRKPPGTKSHEVVVARGSVLAVAPAGDVASVPPGGAPGAATARPAG